MVATMTPARVSRSKPHSVRRPVQKHKVANSEEFKAKEYERSRRDRISIVVGLLLIFVLIALAVWAVMTGDSPNTEAMWEFQYLC